MPTSKRAAPGATQRKSKKPRPASSDEELNSADEALQREMNALLSGAGSSSSRTLEAQLAMLDDSEEEGSEADSEINEFEELGELPESEEEDDLIEDDGEDLLANVDDAADDSEEDDFADLEQDDSPAPAPLVLKKANVRNSRAAVPLKPAELRALAFAELTASPISSEISTRVSAFLAPLTPPTPATSPLQPILKELHAHLTSLPAQQPISLEALRKRSKVVLPGFKAGKWESVELGWAQPRPEDVRIVGSWAWGGSYKSKGEYVVDMAVGMPAALLQAKDYLSPRFQTKSTHYLVTLAALLPSSLGPVATSFIHLPGAQGYALEVRSAHAKGDDKIGLAKAKGAVLRIRCVWTGAGLDAFLPSKLSPMKNQVRPVVPEGETVVLQPTPIHASSLHLSSLPVLTAHLKHFHTVSTSHPAFSATIRLLQAWASARHFGASLGLTSEFWAWCVARTLDWGAGSSASAVGAGSGGEAWAGWRKAVEWLAGMNWTDGIYFRVDGEDAYSKDEFKVAFQGQPIFVDPSGKVNLAAGIDLATLDMLKQDAKTTIAMLLGATTDEQKFGNSFSRELREVERFDNFARINVPTAAIRAAAESAGAGALDFGTPLAYFVSTASASIRRALGTRLRSMQLSCTGSTPKSTQLTLGLLVESAEAGRLVDQGPSAEDEPACVEFRTFWGSKSELRRFKNGSILESVVWEEDAPGGMGQRRNTIVGQIVRYILEERHGVSAANVDFFAGAMDHLLLEPETIRRAIYLEDTVANNKGFAHVITAYDDISKELTGLDDLPLAISSVLPSATALRYSTIFTPSPRRMKDFGRFPDAAKFVQVHDIQLTMDGSGRWPEDLEGVQKIKSAFLAKIGEKLSGLHSIYKAQVVFDLDARPIDDNVSLEILTATGYAFRARIHYERSLLLIQARNRKIGAAPDSSSFDSSLDLYNARFVHGPRHHAALATLQHRFTSYSHTIRLVKRWFSSHLLSNHFPEEMIELLVASVFLDSSMPYEAPNSGATGFARTMEKLSSWAWRDEPLLLPLYTFSIATSSGRRATFPTQAKVAAEAAFELRRMRDTKINDGHAWFIATEEDVEGRVWGKGIGKVAAGRVRGLAKATLETLQAGVRDGGLLVEQLFSPPLADYAFLFHLNAAALPRHSQAISPDPSALVLNGRSKVIMAGTLAGDDDGDDARLDWDPVSDFVRDLETLYPSVFLLFTSSSGTPTIGGIWNPTAETSRPWTVGLGFPVRPVTAKQGETSKAKVQLDKTAILAEVEKLGKGLIRRIEVLRS